MAGPKLSLNAPFVNAQYLENSPPRKLSRRNPLIKSPSRCSIFTEKTSSYLLKLREYEFPLFELPAFDLQHLLQQDVTNQSATGSYSVEDVAQQRPRPKFLRKKWWKDHLAKRRTKVASTDNQDKGDKRAQKEVDVPRLMFTPDIAVESLTHPADKPPTIRRRMATLMRGRSRSMPANEYSEMMFPHHENQRRSWKWLGSKANRSFNDEVRRLDEMGYISRSPTPIAARKPLPEESSPPGAGDHISRNDCGGPEDRPCSARIGIGPSILACDADPKRDCINTRR